jgi:hypothetical protein
MLFRLGDRQKVSPEVAMSASAIWHEEIGTPLRIVAGSAAFSLALPFYSIGGPAEFTHFSTQQAPWITPERIAREGLLGVCAGDDTACIDQAKRYETPDAKKIVRIFRKVFWGLRGLPIEVIMIMVPPRRQLTLHHEK